MTDTTAQNAFLQHIPGAGSDNKPPMTHHP